MILVRACVVGEIMGSMASDFGVRMNVLGMSSDFDAHTCMFRARSWIW